jgi:hypothetical protein
MRPALTLVLLLVAAPAIAASAPASAPHSTSILLRVHPAAWRPPVPAPAGAGMTFTPDTGEPATPFAPAAAAPNRRSLAPSAATIAADGSRHVVLGGAVRAYTVVSVDSRGQLVQDCVHSEAEALRRIGQAAAAAAPAGPAPKPEGH